jgi:hypothetical protein
MLLASNKQQHKEIKKSRKTQQDRPNTQKRTTEKNKDQVGLTRSSPITRLYTESFGILQMLNFQKGILSNPPVLFNKIFREQPLFFRRTIRLTI